MIYRAITDENFYYLDTKKIAKFFKEYTYEELKKYVKENEIIEFSSDRNFQTKINVINKRLSSLNDFLLNTLASETSEVGKVVNLLSIILNEKIVFDFMYEVFLPKYKSSDYFISNSIFFSFMNEKTEQELEVAKWSEASKKKIITKLKTFFVDSGYLIKDGNDYRLVKPIIPGDILENIKDNYKPVVLDALLQI